MNVSKIVVFTFRIKLNKISLEKIAFIEKNVPKFYLIVLPLTNTG